MKLSVAILGVCVALTAAPLAAHDVQLHTCRALASVELRVECYDKIADTYAEGQVQEYSVTGKTVNLESNQEQQLLTIVDRKTLNPEELFGKPQETINEIVTKELDISSVDQIKSVVVKALLNHVKEYTVLLENGQTWKQKGDGGAWRIRAGEVAVISRALFGSFKIKAEGRNRSVSAMRIN